MKHKQGLTSPAVRGFIDHEHGIESIRMILLQLLKLLAQENIRRGHIRKYKSELCPVILLAESVI